jgi:CheY-like chemotaxis protein
VSQRILVVEDNEANQLLIGALLRREGFEVVLAENVDAALAHIAEAHFDLVLTDIRLPGRDGLSMAEELRSKPTTSRLPIVALTAHAMQGDEARALAAGCTGYIAKPIDTRRLVGQLREFMAD